MKVRDRETREITADEYHATTHVSSGGVRCFATEGAWSYYCRYVDRSVQSPDCDARRLGRAFHLAMSDPENWGLFFRVLPSELKDGPELDQIASEFGAKSSTPLTAGTPLNLRSPAHRAYKQLLIDRAAEDGAEFVDETEFDHLMSMGGSIANNPAIAELISSSALQYEVPTFAIDDSTSFGVKAMPDVQAVDFLLDWKTTRQHTREGFLKDAYNFGYQYQAAWYTDVCGIDRFLIASVRNKAPYESMLYEVPERELTRARQTNSQTMEAMALCRDFGDWHTEGWGEISDMTRDIRYAN